MINDPIVEKVRKTREDHAARFNFDLDKVFQDLKNSEKKRGCKVVSRQPKPFLKATGT